MPDPACSYVRKGGGRQDPLTATGDGVGDLLAIDKSGVMWLLAGNGKGGFKGRVWVSSG